MADDRELLSRAYEAFNTRDLDAMMAMLSEDVDWPNGWEGGRLRGRAAVRDYWTRQWASIDPTVDPTGFATDEAGRTVVTVHQVVRDLDGNLLVEGTVAHVYTIRDGAIHRMDIAEP